MKKISQRYNEGDNNRTHTMRHFHDLPSELSQPIIVNTTERMFGGCEDMDACCPGSHKAKQLDGDGFFLIRISCAHNPVM